MRRFWNKVRLYSAAYARPVIVCLVFISILLALFSFRIGTMVPGLSRPEVSSLQFSRNINSIRYNPLNAPVTIPQHFVQLSRFNDIQWLRMISSLFGILVVIVFYRILKRWYHGPVVLLATALFATSSWLLHTSRLSTPYVLQTLVLLFVLLGVEIQRSKGSKPVLFLATLSCILLLYIPGMIWLLVPALVWQRKRIIRTITHTDTWFVVLCSTLLIAASLPLVFAVFVDPLLLRELFTLPLTVPSVMQIFRNFAEVPMQLFISGPANPVIWLGRLPLLEVFSALMFIIGLYASSKTWLLDRTRMVVALFIVLWILVSLGGAMQIAVLLPIVFLMVANGISYMLENWMTIFPRNPIARGVGVGIMSIAVLTVMYYHLQSYFVVWPNTPETKVVFQLKKPY